MLQRHKKTAEKEEKNKRLILYGVKIFFYFDLWLVIRAFKKSINVCKRSLQKTFQRKFVNF